MKNPNNHNVDSSAHLRRTTYDLSHSKHMSGKIGELLPVMFQEVNAGETFHWSPNFNFRFAPTAMPIQTRIKCVVDYFFVPMEAIWKDQTAFFNQGMNHTIAPPQHPWLKMSKSTRNIGTGSVGDYLGVPSAISSKMSYTNRIFCASNNKNNSLVSSIISFTTPSLLAREDASVSHRNVVDWFDSEHIFESEDNPFMFATGGTFLKNQVVGFVFDNHRLRSRGISKAESNDINSRPLSNNNFPEFEQMVDYGLDWNEGLITKTPLGNYGLTFCVRANNSLSGTTLRKSFLKGITLTQYESSRYFTSSYSEQFHINFLASDKVRLLSWYNSLNSDEKDNICVLFWEFHGKGLAPSPTVYGFQPFTENVRPLSDVSTASHSPLIVENKSGEAINYNLSVVTNQRYPTYISYVCQSYTIVPDSLANSPFIGDKPKMPLSPFGHRSYELCYNFFYRNKDIDPLVDNYGHRIVNQFLPDSMRGSGPDTNDYPIRYSLLEKDIFTSCFTEPLVNYNPLIGIRQKNNDIFYDFATSGGVVSMSAAATGVGVTETGTNVNQYTGAMITSYGEGIPQGDLNIFKDIIATGITNQDIYSAQCMQRWISNKVQKGYNFSEQQLAQFGVNSNWNPLTAPSYLGGTAEWINNGVVCNTAQSEEHALGELGGMPSCISNKEHSFSYKASDRGFIIGIMRVVPIPIYSQAIHKVFTKQKYTDYFIPEFDNKGYEAVPKGELVPYLASAENKQEEAFGYQVPWYDYKSAYDTISGDMRTNFNDSVIMRDFGTLPSLSRQFIECHSEDYNDVFVQTKQTDKYIGEIFHNIKAERVIGDYQSRVFANVH